MQPKVDHPQDADYENVDQDAEALLDAEGLADLHAGRVVSGEAVKRWLLSWGTSEVLPTPQIGD